jgi:hypothetical protein
MDYRGARSEREFGNGIEEGRAGAGEAADIKLSYVQTELQVFFNF